MSDDFDERARAAADAALEKEVYERNSGVLSPPYTAYRFHNGFEAGYIQARAELQAKLAAAKNEIERYKSDYVISNLSAFRIENARLTEDLAATKGHLNTAAEQVSDVIRRSADDVQSLSLLVESFRAILREIKPHFGPYAANGAEQYFYDKISALLDGGVK